MAAIRKGTQLAVRKGELRTGIETLTNTLSNKISQKIVPSLSLCSALIAGCLPTRRVGQLAAPNDARALGRAHGDLCLEAG